MPSMGEGGRDTPPHFPSPTTHGEDFQTQASKVLSGGVILLES